MVDHSQLAIGLLNLEVSRSRLDAENVVICRIDNHDGWIGGSLVDGFWPREYKMNINMDEGLSTESIGNVY